MKSILKIEALGMANRRRKKAANTTICINNTTVLARISGSG